MPARLIREGILTSEPVDSLSDAAEVFYRRLMSVADDFGLFHANPKLIRAACYPLRLDRVSEDDVRRLMGECVAAKLLALCTEGGKSIVVILRFGQQQRAKASKYLPSLDQPAIEAFLRRVHAQSVGTTPAVPIDPPADANGPLADASKVPATAHLGVCGVVCGDGGGGDTRVPAREASLAPPVPDTNGHAAPADRTGPDDPIDPDGTAKVRIGGAAEFAPTEATATRQGRIAVWLIDSERAAGRQVRGITSQNPKLLRWVEDGVSDDDIAEAYRLTVVAKAENRDTSPVTIGLIDAKLRDLIAARSKGAPSIVPSKPPPAAWEQDTRTMLAEAERIGLEVREEWSFDQLRWQILQRHRSSAKASRETSR